LSNGGLWVSPLFWFLYFWQASKRQRTDSGKDEEIRALKEENRALKEENHALKQELAAL